MEESKVARLCTSVSLVFHAVSPRPGLVKLLALSIFRHEVDHYVIRVSPDNWAKFMIIVDVSIIGASFFHIGCALLSRVFQTQ